MSLRAWLQPPRSLFVILFLLTLVSVSAVAWFGWRLLAQGSMVEEQRTQERLEQTADRTVVNLRTALADFESSNLGPVFLADGESLKALPPARILYWSFPAIEPEADPSRFAEGEALEFAQGQPEAAAEWFGRLAYSSIPAIRAGALMRLGRTFRNLGRVEESRAAWTKLAAIPGVRVAGAPAELVALTELRSPAAREGLLRGRWHLTHSQFEFFWSRAVPGQPAPVMPAELERAATLAWRERDRAPASGQTTLWVDGHPELLMWGNGELGRVILVTTPATVLARSGAGDDVVLTAVDNDGKVVAGHRDPEMHAAVRPVGESQLPWAIYVTRAGHGADAGRIAGERYLLLAMTVMVLFLIFGTYFIARVIRREMAVARLQSDFVSAVSHEFRSPLTSMRQLSEILAFGRLPNEGRRQLYYETLVNETERLQRLVEKLLNFGGMEAGKRRYHFEPIDTSDLVGHVTAEFEKQIAGSGRLIETHGQATGCRIEADREALSIALRNLVDNALKYSPQHPTVWVEWEREDDSVAIRVRDQGPGIPHAERKAIFHKFVRGSAATAGGVKGMGVGLAMVRHIVVAHGGEVHVASEPGRGSTFTMLLPAVKA